jgi:hypothetical protein
MASSQKSQPRHAPGGALFDDLYDYVAAPARPGRRRAKRASVTLTVTDDWLEDVPVTEAEIAVFEAWFGELFDELFGEGRGGHHHGSSGGSLPPGLDGAASRQRSLHSGPAPPGEGLLRVARLADYRRLC